MWEWNHWYNKTGDIVDRSREGHPCSVHLPNVNHVVYECVRWNPLCKQKQMTVDMNVSTWSLSSTLQDNLKLGAYRSCFSHTSTPRLREIHWTSCAALLQQFNGKKYGNICFTEEKIFTVQYPGKTESSKWQSVRTELLQNNGKDTICHMHAPSPNCDGLMRHVISWRYSNLLL